VYKSHQTLIGSWLYCQLAFRQQLSHTHSSYPSTVPAKGKVESRNQGNHYYHQVFMQDAEG